MDAILAPYLKYFEKHGNKVKPLEIIVITDRKANGDLKSVIFGAAEKLDKLKAPPWQVEIQFIQVGQGESTAKALGGPEHGLSGQAGGKGHRIVNNSELNREDIMNSFLAFINRRRD